MRPQTPHRSSTPGAISVTHGKSRYFRLARTTPAARLISPTASSALPMLVPACAANALELQFSRARTAALLQHLPHVANRFCLHRIFASPPRAARSRGSTSSTRPITSPHPQTPPASPAATPGCAAPPGSAASTRSRPCMKVLRLHKPLHPRPSTYPIECNKPTSRGSTASCPLQHTLTVRTPPRHHLIDRPPGSPHVAHGAILPDPSQPPPASTLKNASISASPTFPSTSERLPNTPWYSTSLATTRKHRRRNAGSCCGCRENTQPPLQRLIHKVRQELRQVLVIHHGRPVRIRDGVTLRLLVAGGTPASVYSVTPS